MTDQERFSKSVEQFIADTKMSPTAFGREFAGDPLFVFQMRNGRESRSDTRDRILAAISKRRAAA
jgi:homoserine dehydrogenase